MKNTRITKATRLIAGLLTCLLFAILAVPLGAQPAPDSRTSRVVVPAYDAAHEITLNGSIQKVVTKHVKGTPAGMHLMVTGSKGLVDTHLGPFMSKETKEALVAGVPVKIVGAMKTERGKNYLMARELTVSGRTITVRNEHGALAHPVTRARHPRTATKETAKVELNGGAR
jgi:hypothetical protein